jgi:hypothetical protein
MSTTPPDESLSIASESVRGGNRSERRHRTSNLGTHTQERFLSFPVSKFRRTYAAAVEWLSRQSACCDLQVRVRSLELIKIKSCQIEKCQGLRCARPQFIRPDRSDATCAHQGAHLSRLSINRELAGLKVCRRRGAAPSNCCIWSFSWAYLNGGTSSDRRRPRKSWDSRWNLHGRFDAPRSSNVGARPPPTSA